MHGRLWIRKSIDQIQREASAHDLRRSLGPLHLTFIGVGCIIGAGIYVMTGNAAANFAGPAVILSFVIAGLGCGFAGVCYAELASTMPVAGSSYTYTYAALGEMFAWIMAWLLVLEYAVAAATVAVGFSGYATSLLGDLGLHIPVQWSAPLIQSVAGPHGLTFHPAASVNLVAAAGVLAVTSLLVLGVSESARVNSVMVVVKVGVLLAFIGFGAFYVDTANWHPFIPVSQGGFTYGVAGIFRAASVVFFAYIGFEAVSIAASEARNPRRDVPMGILGSLALCTVIYIAVAAVLTGVAPFKLLGVAEPLTIAVDRMGAPWFAKSVKLGALAGLSSVMLVLLYGQSRLFYAIARDGLLPPMFARLHQRFRTPWIGTWVLGICVSLTAAALPITILGDLVSLGTTVAFAMVAGSVIYLRNVRPELHRPFRVPGGALRIGGIWLGYIPLLAIAFSVLMAAPLLLDVAAKTLRGDVIPAAILTVYIAVGAGIYRFYGLRNSRLAQGQDILQVGLSPVEPIAAIEVEGPPP